MKVLIVEDEPAISRILSRKIKQMGHEVEATDVVSQAAELIKHFKPEVIFLDYVLKDGRSRELAVSGALKPDHRIFLMSAFMDDLEKSDFANLDVTYLKKPFKDLKSVLGSL